MTDDHEKALEAAVGAICATGLLEGDEARSAASACVAAYLAAREAAGWVMVPVEATAEGCLGAVLCAGELFTSEGHFKVNQEKALENLRNLIASRPRGEG